MTPSNPVDFNLLDHHLSLIFPHFLELAEFSQPQALTMLRSKSRSGYLEFGQKKQPSFLIRSISGSKICRGDALASQVDKQALVSVDRHSISLSENRIVKAAMMEKEMRNLEEELKNTKEKLAQRDEQFKKQIRELEDQLEKTKESESHMLDSLMLQTRQIEQTKMDLEESKLEVITLREKLLNLPKGSRNDFDGRGNFDSSSITKALKDEIVALRNELKFATEAEEKSRKAMDDLATALSEVAMQSSTANEKLRLSEEQGTHLKKEIERLHEELELQTETSERLRVEFEESVLAWTAKEMGFIDCIKRADEENASLKHENHKLNEALVPVETTTRTAREEAFKLRDILKEALNESSVAKEASNIARAENSELKDLLAEKEESLHFLTKENERLRINEVASLSASGQSEEAENNVHRSSRGNHHHHHHHTEDGDDKGSYMYGLNGLNGLYNKKKLFRKIGELINGKNNSKKEGSAEQGKKQGKDHVKEQGKDRSKEQVS